MAAHTPEETRALILSEAERLFRHYGYAKTTIADISDACDMSPANIYRFFPSKSALTEAICGHIIGSMEQHLCQIVRLEVPASERLAELLRGIHHNTLENLIDHRKVHEMVVVALEEQWLALRTHLEHVEGFIAQIIEDGVASGEFAPCDVARTAKATHAAMAAFCHPVLVAMKLQDDERAAPDEVAQLIVNGLKHGGVAVRHD